MIWIRILDWTAALASILGGWVFASRGWMIGGGFGLILAWWNPSLRVRNLLFRRMIKSRR